MSLLNGELPGKNSRSRKSTSSRITAPNGSVISKASSSKSKGQTSGEINSYNNNIKRGSIVSHTRSEAGKTWDDNFDDKKSLRNSVVNSNNNLKRGSIVSHTQSDKSRVQASKCGSVVSGVSTQLARRKKKRDTVGSNLAARSMSANSLAGRSNETLFRELKNQPKSQSVISLAVESEIQILGLEEKNMILLAIKKSRQYQRLENRRKQTLQTKINEIKSMRPPFPLNDPQMCYICYSQFWPLFSTKIRCSICNIIVCKKCFKEYKVGNICSQCALEILYTAQMGSVFDQYDLYNIDTYDGLDIPTIERMLVKTTELELRTNISKHSNEYADALSVHSNAPESEFRTNMSKHSNDRTDATSTHSKAASVSQSLMSKLLFRKNKDSSANASHRTSLNEVAPNPDDLNISTSSVMSNSNDNDYVAVNGEIMIGLSYNFNKEEFTVIIKKCRDIPAALKKENISNPFVKISLLPEIEGEEVCQTKVKYSNLNPVYNEQCKFKNITFDELVARTVLVSVFHCEWAGKDIFLGQKLINLSSHSFENATAFWYKLEDRGPVTIPPSLSKYYGDIVFSIKYTKTPDKILTSKKELSDQASATSKEAPTGAIMILINAANNLFSYKYNKLPNSYVKCVLLNGTSIEDKAKSHIVRKSFNPVYDYRVTFLHISHKELNIYGLEITVWDKKIKFIPDVLLGGISMNTRRGNRSIYKSETEVWDKMIEKPETWIEAKLTLRTDIG